MQCLTLIALLLIAIYGNHKIIIYNLAIPSEVIIYNLAIPSEVIVMFSCENTHFTTYIATI